MKKTAYLLLCISLLSCNKLKDYWPKPPGSSLPQFNNVFGGSEYDGATAIAASPDGGYLVAGYTLSNDGDVIGHHGSENTDGWILKLDKNGNKIWQKPIGGTSGDGLNTIVASPGGGYVLAGNTRSQDGDASGNHGEMDFWVVKIDEAGALLWQKQLGGSKDDHALSMIASPGGGYVLVGSTYSKDGDVRYRTGVENAWIVKLDENGNRLWQRALGGTHKLDADAAKAVATTADSGYMVVGRTYRNPKRGGDIGNSDILIAKLDAVGNLVWQNKVSTSGTEEANAIVKSADGGFLVAGSIVSQDYNHTNILLLKLDGEGTLEWQKTIPSTTIDRVVDIILSGDGGYLLTGSANTIIDAHGEYSEDYNALVLKIDAAGNTRWRKTLGGSESDSGNALLKRSDGSYVMAGGTESNDGDVKSNHGKTDVWVVTIVGSYHN
jgi:hypothetical protein